MSEFAIKVLEYYRNDLWDISRVQKALEVKYITQDEYNEIVKNK